MVGGNSWNDAVYQINCHRTASLCQLPGQESLTGSWFTHFRNFYEWACGEHSKENIHISKGKPRPWSVALTIPPKPTPPPNVVEPPKTQTDVAVARIPGSTKQEKPAPQRVEITPAILALMLLSGSFTAFLTINSATIQSVVPDELRGRVSSIGTMTLGLFPLGSLVAGGLAELYGAPAATLLAGGALAALSTAIDPIDINE